MRMKGHDEVVEETLRSRPGYRELWERTALARAVAGALVRYRSEHHLSQRALARRLGWRQSQVARLELAEHNPSLETLTHLSRTLGMHFLIAIGQPEVQPRPGDVVERMEMEEASIVAAAG